jgi:hypothetical protein
MRQREKYKRNQPHSAEAASTDGHAVRRSAPERDPEDETMTPDYAKICSVLEAPLEYGGLPKRKEAKLRLRVWTYPAFDPYRAWAIYVAQDGCWLRRLTWRYDPQALGLGHFYGCETALDAAFLEGRIAALKAICLSPFDSLDHIGLDGVSCGVELSGFLDKAHVRWWCDGPPSFAPLVRWHEETCEALEALLPAASVDDAA